MNKLNIHQLFASLQNDIKYTIAQTQHLLNYDDEVLNIAPLSNKWSIAQVVQHLNTYNDFYLPAIERALQQARPASTGSNTFTPGWLGNYLTKMMQVDASGKVTNKTKAFKKHIPAAKLDARFVLEKFMADQHKFQIILAQAAGYDVDKIRIGMSISSLIRLKLGDILRVLVVHQMRHFVQIAEAKELILNRQGVGSY